MKLRIKGNTLRLRLTQGEVDEFREQGSVSAVTVFDPAGTRQLTYALSRSETCKQVEASFLGDVIEVRVPGPLADKWVHTNRVGFDNEADPEDLTSLFILVEKDFQCLHKRPHEDESDHFPNPLAQD